MLRSRQAASTAGEVSVYRAKFYTTCNYTFCIITVGTHSGWKVPASIDLSLASAVTFNWSESRYAALVRKGSPPRNNIIDGLFPPAVGAYCKVLRYHDIFHAVELPQYSDLPAEKPLILKSTLNTRLS